MLTKPYLSIPIKECGEPLVTLPADLFPRLEPHPYVAAGAPYGGASPWQVRASVLAGLVAAQAALSKVRPGWRLAIYDAYRPHAVQAYMVARECDYWQKTGLDAAAALAKTLQIWAIPSDDPATPPLHSTGGAVDVTLQDAASQLADMGSPIDENSERSIPDYFGPTYARAAHDEPPNPTAHANRQLLRQIMLAAGFTTHLLEWWHYDLGTQYWAWAQRGHPQQPADNTSALPHAIYGRADLLTI